MSPDIDQITKSVLEVILKTRFEHRELVLLCPLIVLAMFLYVARGGINRKKVTFLLSRFLITICAVMAIASPYLIESVETMHELPPVTILLDTSSSMNLYNTSGERIQNDLKNMMGNLTGKTANIDLIKFSEGNRTWIGNALFQAMSKSKTGNELVVLISDGNNNYGKDPVMVSKAMANINTTVFALTPRQTSDGIYIHDVRGSRKVPINSEYGVTVSVRKTSEEPSSYGLKVYVDGAKRYGKNIVQRQDVEKIPLSFNFSQTGIYKLEFTITPENEDAFELNNRFYKTVEVVEKPDLLLISNRTDSPLANVLDEIYNVTITKTLPTSYGDFTTVIVDDINAKHLDSNAVNTLKDFLLNGNGLIVVGGRDSYEYGNYNNSYIETLLPVRSVEKPTERRKEIAVMFLIDVSESTEYAMSGTSGKTKIDKERELAINMVRDLNLNDSVGVIAFNIVPFLITPIEKLSANRDAIIERILQLRFGGGTDILPAFNMAGDLLRPYSCNKYIILISDGVVRRGSAKLSNEKAQELAKQGVTVYTIGVGFDTNEILMSKLAESGHGLYFKPEEYQKLKIEFGRAVAEEEGEYSSLEIHDRYHFITHALNLSGIPIKDFNKAYEKSISRVLVTSKGGKPILTVWNFGLGRVASLTTDNGLQWSGRLYSDRGSRLVTAMTNWAIGDMEKGRKVTINSEDVSLGDTAVITISSKEKPTVSIEHLGTGKMPDCSLKRTDLNSYTSQFTPSEIGFYLIKATVSEGYDLDAVVVNYPDEFSSLGTNVDLLSTITTITGGALYNSNEIGALELEIVKRARKIATKEIIDKKPVWIYFAGFALLLFFIDIVIRRTMDIFRLRRK